MFEKLLLAVTITLSLSLFTGSGSLRANRTMPNQQVEQAQLASLLNPHNLLQNLFQPRAPRS
jgi:hypothetical protein